jgi:hypothetical protein
VVVVGEYPSCLVGAEAAAAQTCPAVEVVVGWCCSREAGEEEMPESQDRHLLHQPT